MDCPACGESFAKVTDRRPTPTTKDGSDVAAEFVIKIMRDQAGNNSLAYVEGVDLTGSWCSTPEAALIDLMEAARKKWRTLGASSVKSVQENGDTDLYVWLTRTFA